MNLKEKYTEPELTNIEIDTNIVRMLASKPTDAGGLFPGFDTNASSSAETQSFAPQQIDIPETTDVGTSDNIKW